LQISKIWLKYSFLILVVLYIFWSLENYAIKSIYQADTKQLSGQIIAIKQDNNRFSFLLKTPEKVIVNYYFENALAKKQAQTYQLGDFIKVVGEIRKPPTEVVFNLFNYRRYLKSQNIYWLFNSTEITLIEKNNNFFLNLKQKVKNRIAKLEKTSDYVTNFILGENMLDDQVIENYKINGVLHLLAISGAHIGFLILVLKKLKIPDWLIVPFLIFYLFLTNFTMSLLRAVCFYILLIINRQLKIKNEWLLIYLALFFLIINPFLIYSIGFQFSFLISFFLIHFSYLINQPKNYLSKAFIISLIAFLASVPILINNFFEINLLTPLINLIFVPIFTIIIYPLALLTFILPSLENIFFYLIQITENLAEIIAAYAWLMIIPKPSLIIFLFYYLLIYLFFKKKQIRYLGLLSLIILMQKNIFYYDRVGYLTGIDVGQGDAILIETAYRNNVILVDTGGIFFPDFRQFLAENRIIPYLKSRGITKIDLLVLTHGHYDHLGEAITLMKNFPVKKVLLNSGSLNEQEKRIVDFLNKNAIPYQKIATKTLNLNNENLYFLNSKNPYCENEDSLVFQIEINNHQLLFMGDAGIETEEDILKNLSNIDFLKVGHHGSRYSTGNLFLKKTTPKYAYIPAGLNNRFNHPHPEVLKRLEKNNVKYLISSEVGSVFLKFDEKITIFTTKKRK